ncbi:MAG: hypothetical protein ABF838_07185 [Lentilactobacillus hilgardii]
MAMVLRHASKNSSLGYIYQITIYQLATVLKVKQLSLEKRNNPTANHAYSQLLKDLVALVFSDTNATRLYIYIEN